MEPKSDMRQGVGTADSGSANCDAVMRLDSRSLFRAAREVIIEHDGAAYRLRLTASGKLILTK